MQKRKEKGDCFVTAFLAMTLIFGGDLIYLVNVKNTIFRNLRWHMSDGGDKEDLLRKVILYCEKLLNDPAEPKVRKRVRSGSGKYGGDK
jgi:hypothetical protein